MFHVSVVFTFHEVQLCRLLCILCILYDEKGVIWNSQNQENSRPLASVGSTFYVA
jgi:hypothetical protein